MKKAADPSMTVKILLGVMLLLCAAGVSLLSGGVSVTQGVAVGLLMIAAMGILAVVGVGQGAQRSAARVWVVVGFVVYAGVFVGLIASASWGGSEALVLGLPKPTLWLLFGIWQLPWLLVLLLVRRFEEWTLNPEDRARFDRLIETRMGRK